MPDIQGETPKVEQAAVTVAQPTPEPASETPAELKARMETMAKALKEANAEAAARRKRLEELEAAEAKRNEAQMSELDKANKRATELEAKLKEIERTELARKVAEKAGLPAELASRLRGETPDELEADAKILLDAIPKPAQRSPGIITNPGGNANPKEEETEKRKRLFG